ncbi:MAG TPA: hypothetical protein VHT75_17780 [Acidimicrobiales bacterium]|nr:hypothetical protein [Acidimicrobiales bacterium]
MIQLLLIVLPCTLVGTSAVLLVQRAGWLPRIDAPSARPSPPASTGATWPQQQTVRQFGTADHGNWSAPRLLLVAVVAILSAWILVWIIVLIIGLNIISGAS